MRPDRVADRLGAKLRGNGIPYLTVLDDEGKPIANQDTGSLEDGPEHDPAKVKDFLTKFQAPPQDAAGRVKSRGAGEPLSPVRPEGLQAGRHADAVGEHLPGVGALARADGIAQPEFQAVHAHALRQLVEQPLVD